MSWAFLATSLVVVVAPGTGVLYTLAVALGRGFGPGVAAAAGCTLGIVPSALASVVGLAAILHASALAFTVVKALGVAYLLYMAWSMLRAQGAFDVAASTTRAGALRIARDGALLNVLNPKLTLFFLSFLPQFVPADTAQPAIAMTALTAVFMAMTFAVFVGYAAAAAWARDAVVSRPAVVAWLRRCFAASFALLGLRLALAER